MKHHFIDDCQIASESFGTVVNGREGETTKKKKKCGAGSKWRFNYNGRLITAIAHHEPFSSRNSRIIRASGLKGIVDFPADTLDTLGNSSPFSPIP